MGIGEVAAEMTGHDRRQAIAARRRAQTKALREALIKIATIRTHTIDNADNYHQLMFCTETAAEALATFDALEEE